METTDCSDCKRRARRRPGGGSRVALGMVVAVAALAIVTAASPASGSVRMLLAARATDQPYLDSLPSSTALSTNGDFDLLLHEPGMSAAKVVLSVPAGYGLRTDQAPGTKIGLSLGWSGSLGTPGDITAVDPMPYLSDPGAQACAPGAHAAVWLFELGSFRSPSEEVPIFIDSTTSGGVGTSAYQLQFCLPQPSTGARGLDALELEVDSALTNPGTPGAYEWSAQVTPATTAGTPDQPGTYELRSLVPLPSRIALVGRPDRLHRYAILNGHFIASSISYQGTPINLYARPAGSGLFRYQAWTRTTGTGAFSFSRPLHATTSYYAEVGEIGNCAIPSTAPGGCRNETLDTTSSPTVRVRKR
jgi:hypothetical protein